MSTPISTTIVARCALAAALGLAAASPVAAQGSNSWKLIAWNDLGMHCMDADFSVFAILPPYNTIHAQLVDPNGLLVVDGTPYTVTYEGVADPTGSVNLTSAGKTGFWDHVLDLFGSPLSVDQGLAGHDMPGVGNTPQPMVFEAGASWFTAEGIPLTPWDDALSHNPYPLMRIVARDDKGKLLAETRIVLPVSDEMDCSACHASGSGNEAKPAAGWVDESDPQRDYRLNILRLHDQLQLANPLFADALADRGFEALGLEATARGGRAILCASCHPSNALPGSGLANLTPLTTAVHDGHAGVLDPAGRVPLGDAASRGACYRCHPGSTTRCLRGAMGHSIGADGLPAMECQSCHGGMAAVGAGGRTGWLAEPGCQSCHTGTATTNSGEIRFTSVFVAPGVERNPADPTFATQPNVPAPGFDLFRFSYGHGGLACEACHGSTHAVYPSSHDNDNLQSLDLQGHAGALERCASCHAAVPDGPTGPHGMHRATSGWASGHGDWIEQHGASSCRACHGADGRGSVLSAAQADRTLTTEWGSRTLWRGFRVSCYLCHDGPGSESPTPNHAPVATPAAVEVVAAIPFALELVASDPDGDPLALRIVGQPAHAAVGLTGTTARIYPEAGWSGADGFTFAAWDGMSDSNLASVVLTVSDGGLFGDGFESGSTVRWTAAFE